MSKRAKTLEADVRLNFEMWKAARDIATSCDDRMKESEVTHHSSHPLIGQARTFWAYRADPELLLVL